jgi:hypothetical protein
MLIPMSVRTMDDAKVRHFVYMSSKKGFAKMHRDTSLCQENSLTRS